MQSKATKISIANLMKALQNKKAVKLLNKLIDDASKNGLITNTAIEDLKTLRPFTITEEIPLLAKATRLAYEHIDEYGTFAIPIPDEESIENEEETIAVESDVNESFHYFLSLISNVDKKVNEDELREYVTALREY